METATGDVAGVLAGFAELSADSAAGDGRRARGLPPAETLRRIAAAVERALTAMGGSPDGTPSLRLDSSADASASRSAAADPDPTRVRLRAFVRFHAGEAVLEIPVEAARALARKVSGAAALPPADLLTSLEEGIVAFFVEQLVSAASAEVPELGGLTLQAIGSENGQPDMTSGRIVAGSAMIRGQAVPFRLLAPAHALEETRRQLDTNGMGLRDAMHAWLRRLGDVAVDFGARVGQVSLSAADLAGVEANDIVLLDPTELSIDEGALSGRATLVRRRGLDSSGSIVGQLEQEDGRLRFRVEQVVEGNLEAAVAALAATRTAEGEVAEESAEADADEAPDGSAVAAATDFEAEDEMTTDGAAASGASLLPELPVTLKVEVARLSLTLGQLAELAPGSVLELRRDASTATDLVVEDRVVGRGELLSVDGQLGVRVISWG